MMIEVAATPPTVTDVPGVNPVPVSVMVVPPTIGPELGVTLVSAGAIAT